MDFTLLQAVLQSDLPSSQRLIMLIMLNHADTEGKAWPSHATIARQAGLGERSVWTHVHALHQAGWLAKVGNFYRVAIFQVTHPAKTAASPSQNLPDDPANIAAHPANIAGESRSICGLTTHETPNNHPRTSHRQTARPSRAGETSSSHLNEQTEPATRTRSETQTTPSTPHASPKPGWREWNRQQAHEANAIPPGQHAPVDFHTAWEGWQGYRTRRATEARTASEAVPWTRDAAQAGLRECERAAGLHGWPAVAARIDQAISGGWQGINTDKISATRPQSSPAHAAPRHGSFRRTDSANRPGRYT